MARLMPAILFTDLVSKYPHILSHERVCHTAIHIDTIPCAFVQMAAHQHKDAIGYVVNGNDLVQDSSFCVKRGQLLDGDAVRLGPALRPLPFPYFAAFDD